MKILPERQVYSYLIYTIIMTKNLSQLQKKLSQLQKICANYGKISSLTQIFRKWFIFLQMAQIFGLSGFWLSKLRDVLVIIVMYTSQILHSPCPADEIVARCVL